MFDELWQEIQDMPGEIFDIPERKLSMQFQITNIEFDCSLDEDIFNEGANPEDYWSESDRICTEEKLAQEYIGQILEVDNEEDLVHGISDATGWCIKSIDYRTILK